MPRHDRWDPRNHEERTSTTSTTDSSSLPDDDSLVIRNYTGNFPLFFESEIKVDKLLGTGSFCMAWTIRQIELRHGRRLPHQDRRQRLARRVNAAAAKKPDPRLAIHGKNATEMKAAEDPATAAPRCVIKRLRTDVYAHFEDLSRAQQDLKAELEILLRVGTGDHPNIIELYGLGTGAPEPPDENNDEDETEEKEVSEPSLSFQPTFLIISRIRTTLDNLIRKWRDQRGIGFYEALAANGTQTRQLWLERMLLLARLADAVRYLHSQRILFRDLKPENVGLDDNDVVKLFDFGLGKQMPEQDGDENCDHNQTFRLTGETGTPRYMAPEVMLCKPYGYKVDVYSLGILIHEVLSLKTPFTNVPSGEFRTLVMEFGVRPEVDATWPHRLQVLIQQMWDPDQTVRPTAETVVATFSELLRGSDEELFPTSSFSMASMSRWFKK